MYSISHVTEIKIYLLTYLLCYIYILLSLYNNFGKHIVLCYIHFCYPYLIILNGDPLANMF